MAEEKRFWMSLPEYHQDREHALALDEFPLGLPDDDGWNRRDFLKAAGFGVAAVSLSGCGRAPVREVATFVAQPETVVPGRPLNYATTCGGCSAGCGVLAKCRDGRPIKLEGNPEHPLSHGGLCAVGQASLLGLYDSQRLMHPLKNGHEATWATVDQDIGQRLAEVRRDRGAVRILSNTITSPTLQATINRFVASFPDARHVMIDALSASAILDAHQSTHGVRVLPRYRLERADVIVGLDADFLGTWLSPVEFTHGYRVARNLEGHPPRCALHVQFESRLSLTGGKADQRHRVTPGDIGVILTYLADKLDRGLHPGRPPWNSAAFPTLPVPAAVLHHLAETLFLARGKSLVLCGSQEIEHQRLCNFINQMLASYGNTIDLERPSLQRQGSDQDLRTLLGDLEANRVAALLLLDTNPAFQLPGGERVAQAIRRVPLVVSCAERLDETAELARYVCPFPHFLASWSDAEPVSGLVSLSQPTFPALGQTRPIVESLSAWLDLRPERRPSALQSIQAHWREAVHPRSSVGLPFEEFWDRTVHDGFAEVRPSAVRPTPFNQAEVRPILRATLPPEDGFALVLHPSLGMLDGRAAYNPWLHELPDPVTKVTWDNYASLSPAAAARLDVRDGDILRLEVAESAIELPVQVQPGQHDQVVAVPLGYGSKLSARFANVGPRWLEARPTLGENGLVGTNAAPLLLLENNALKYVRPAVTVTRTGRHHALACTQSHHTLAVPPAMAPPGRAVRPMVQETTLAGFAAAGPPHHEPHADLWPADHATPIHRWAMVIDLSACTGCSACVVACQAENNIPVVGKDEVRRQREMHWMRVDRYYADRGRGDVDVAFQPMLCQHCGNAPCETVCPVLATAHSSEGLNQQVYNRCVGTRYCANNCPYKVRRFNWFAYPREDPVQNLVLNPEVTVRSRGVMEKCSFCVQRIQEAKLEARRLGVALADGATLTACQQSCPAQAIVFGDLNDPRSKVAQMQRDRRRYQVLAELNVQPSVSYLSVVRNRTDREGGAHG